VILATVLEKGQVRLVVAGAPAVLGLTSHRVASCSLVQQDCHASSGPGGLRWRAVRAARGSAGRGGAAATTRGDLIAVLVATCGRYQESG
jgi:hypothetical protein